MRTFQDYMRDRLMEGKVYRADQQKISDFRANMGHYAFLPGDAGSGRVDDPTVTPDWAKGKEYQVRQGLFAGDKREVAAYLVPRDIKWVVGYETQGKPTIYFNKQDRKKISNHRPVISAFDSKGFERLDTGEFFSTSPSMPVSQQRVANPWTKIRNRYEVKFVDNLVDLLRNLKSQGIHYSAEGDLE